jgi:hypothetical protein
MVLGCLAFAREKGSSTPTRDAVLLFVGWLQFALMRFILKKEIRANEIDKVLEDAATAVRLHAADHNLAAGYLDRSRDDVQAAFVASKGSVRWVAEYYDRVGVLTSIDRTSFLALLARETLPLGDILVREAA